MLVSISFAPAQGNHRKRARLRVGTHEHSPVFFDRHAVSPEDGAAGAAFDVVVQDEIQLLRREPVVTASTGAISSRMGLFFIVGA